MSLFHKNTLLGASGAGGAAEALYVDDVYSTFVYEGTGSSNTITNDIDLSGEGGMVWVKARDSANAPIINDTERGAGETLRPDSSNAEFTNSGMISSFNSDGFTLGTAANVNSSGTKYVGWTFRKAPGFFDVVTYTGNGSSTGDSQTISHNLGSTPGFVIIKRTSGTGDWVCWHRSISTGQPRKYIELDSTNGTGTMGVDIWGTVSSTEFEVKHNGTVGDSYEINKNGETYVAYFFAHDDQSFGDDSDEAIIKCGSFSGSIGNGGFVDLGFEPQWVMTKRVDSTSDWTMCDIMRGATDNFATTGRLKANKSDAEDNFRCIFPQPTGFLQYVEGASAATMIYIAIRRPHKPPTAGTDVFAAQASRSASDGTASQLHFTSNFPVDLLFQLCRAGNSANAITVDRIRGGQYLQTNNALAEQSTIWKFDSMDGVYFTTSTSATSDFGANMFRRYPGVFDVVGYDGSGGNQTINHNLKVIPELMIIKARNDGQNWLVYPGDADEYLLLNTTGAQAAFSFFNSTEPTSTQFTIGSSWSASGKNYIAYLFATLDGISKVGTYSGTGSDVDVDCGFSAGARFILIKRTDSTGDWYIWDSSRGIATGNDPYLELNTGDAEVTSTDYIDPLNSGFTVTSSAPAALNASGGTYLFLAIA